MPYNNLYMRDGRFGGFFVPFLLGGLAGGAAVGISRPRPVIAYPGPYQGSYPGPYPVPYPGPYPRPYPYY